MERPGIEDNSTAIEVLDGQTSVEELLADLGFEWRADPASGTTGESGADPCNQPALF